MTPDMKRLCEAAGVGARDYVRSENPADDELEFSYMPRSQAEAIVRAVLIELRNTSGSMVRAGLETPGDAITPAFTAMIDFVLAEPAAAAKGSGIVRTTGWSGPQLYEGQQGKGSWVD